MTVKKQVLALLEQNRGTAKSGQALADALSVSRVAVWKAVQALRAEGYPIEAGTNKGYWLQADSDLLSQEGVRVHLPGALQDIPILVYDTVTSTNTVAKRLLTEGEKAPAVVLADSQTQGRGRLGRSFFSPARTGLYLSILLRPKGDMEALSRITIAAAVAVAEAIEALTELKPQIKWVNDLFLDGKKICGILSEAISDFESGRVESVVVGIGVNVKAPEEGFPLELREIAGGLKAPSGLTRNHLAAEIISRFLSWMERLSDPMLLEAYRSRSFLLGQEIRYEWQGREETGRAEAIDEQGRLLVRLPDGTSRSLRSGEVTVCGWHKDR